MRSLKRHSSKKTSRTRLTPVDQEKFRLKRKLYEALAAQDATGEVLRIISNAKGDLAPIFQAVLENAVRICKAKFGTLYRIDESGGLHLMAQFNTPPEFMRAQRRTIPFRPTPGSLLDRTMQTKKVTYSRDESTERVPGLPATVGGGRSSIRVPMLKDGMLVGAITIFHRKVCPFTENQTSLLQNFAAQAVIAIENARLLNELRQRTDDLTEALEQQTGTAEVLKVISSSPGYLAPVFEALLVNAQHLCGAKFGTLLLSEGDAFRTVALHGATSEYTEARSRATYSTRC